MKKKLKKLEKRVDAIAMEVVTLKNKGNDPLVNIDFNALSFEEAHKQAYESICKHYGITDTEVKGVTFNQQPKEEKPDFKPVFMKCTQEQFDRMRPKLESVGCECKDIRFHKEQYIVNNYSNKYNLISTADGAMTKYHNRTEVHTEAEFLEACGYVDEKIEYTLENIQVDCRELSEVETNNIAKVFKTNGYTIVNFWKSDRFNYIRLGEYHKKNITFLSKGTKQHTITYEKFMELFSEKPIEELHAEHKEAKREPKKGDVVKAWDDDKSKFVYGVLYKIESILMYKYKVGTENYKNIELVTEININDFKREEN